MTIVALVTDLMFSSRISAEARAAEVPMKFVSSTEALRERLAAGNISLVILDLNSAGLDVSSAIAACRAAAHPPRIVGFAAHVQGDVIKAAHAAGADEVLARSAFVQKLPAILSAARQP
jgi:DNA-binding NarL/FixJ family response regulator